MTTDTANLFSQNLFWDTNTNTLDKALMKMPECQPFNLVGGTNKKDSED